MKRLLQINWTDIQHTSEEVDRTLYTFPVHIRVLAVITLVFILIILLLLFIILSSRIYKTRNTERRDKLKKEYQPIFSRLLFEEDAIPEGEKLSGLFKTADLHRKFYREKLLDEIIHLHENFTGEVAERLELLFIRLGFHEDSIRRLKSRHWHHVARGMRELALMNVKEAYPLISPFVSHKNQLLRHEARVALMKLSDTNHLSFLSKETEKLSDWDQANIYTMLSKMPESVIPDFSQWLNSTNKSVVNFSITMIGAFQQQQSSDVLLNMLDLSDDHQKLLIIRSLRMLNNIKSEEKLCTSYPSFSSEVQREALRTLETIGTTRSKPLFIKLLQQPQEDISMTVQIIRSLLSIGPEGKQMAEELYKSGGDRIRLAIEHARDKRL